MVLFLIFVTVAAIVVAIPSIRNCIVPRRFSHSRIARGGFSIATGRAVQSSVAGPVKQFLIVVLPDGTVITPRVAGQV